MAKLLIHENGKDAVYELFADTPEVLVGRGAANAIQVTDGHASKQHVALRRIRDRWRLVDLETKNGTRVNGAFVNARWLADGDVLAVGAVTLRFDAEGEPAGAPPRAAVPLAAVPLAAVPVAAAPSVPVAGPGAPAAARPAAARPAVARPQPARAAPAPAAEPAPARAAPRRRDDDDEEGDGEEERARPRRKQGLGGGVLALLLVLGVGVVALLISMLMSGENPNTVLRKNVGDLRKQGRFAEALAWIERDARAGEPGYGALMKERAELQAQIALQAEIERNNEAQSWFTKNVSYRVKVKGLAPKGHLSDREAAGVLRDFLARYGDTPTALALVNDTVGTNVEYQRLLRENPDPARTDATAWAEAERAIADFSNGQRLGKAYARLTLALQCERLNLPGEAFGKFEARVRERQEDLRQRARTAVQRALADNASLAQSGEKESAKAAVKAVVALIAWPDPEMLRLAEDGLRGW